MMKTNLDYNIRSGRAFNFVEKLDDLELKYRATLKASIDTFDSWDDVQAETYNDELLMRNTIETYGDLGYLEKEEVESMVEYARKIRLEMLDALDKIKKDGE